jgi:hypothetical protein
MAEFQHPQVEVSGPSGAFHCDAEIAELLRLCQAAGIPTRFSCQGEPYTKLPRRAPWRRALQLAAWLSLRLGHRALERTLLPKAYISFPTVADLEAFYELACDALAAAPEAGPTWQRARACSYWPFGLSDDELGIQDARELAAGGWELEVHPGLHEAVPLRGVIRFPHQDLAPLTAAIRRHSSPA